MTDSNVIVLRVPDTTTTSPTNALRWALLLNGNMQLQQRFALTRYVGGNPVGIDYEWRELPVVVLEV